MYKSPELHFQADPLELAATELLLFPICISITRPQAVEALSEAKRIAEVFDRVMAGVPLATGQLLKLDFNDSYDTWQGKFTIQPFGKNEIKLILSYGRVLTFPPESDFWLRAQSVAACIDAIQGFCTQNHGKQIEVMGDVPQPQRVKFIASQSVKP
jgi:hypothetical protein